MVECIILNFQKFQTFRENTIFFNLNPLKKVITKQIDAFCGTNISSNKRSF